MSAEPRAGGTAARNPASDRPLRLARCVVSVNGLILLALAYSTPRHGIQKRKTSSLKARASWADEGWGAGPLPDRVPRRILVAVLRVRDQHRAASAGPTHARTAGHDIVEPVPLS